jgi:hypothetical protein
MKSEYFSDKERSDLEILHLWKDFVEPTSLNFPTITASYLILSLGGDLRAFRAYPLTTKAPTQEDFSRSGGHLGRSTR